MLTSTSPLVSVAAHSDADTQETPVRALFVIDVAELQDEPPASGSVLVRTLPERSAATHRPEGVHETELKECSGSTRCWLQLATGDVGFPVTNTVPPESTATHNPSDAQETPVGVAPSSKVLGPDQLSGAAATAERRARSEGRQRRRNHHQHPQWVASGGAPGRRADAFCASSRYPPVVGHLAPSNASGPPELRSRRTALRRRARRPERASVASLERDLGR